MASNRTFEQAATALLARYDRAAEQLRAALARPFVGETCAETAEVERVAERVAEVVRDIVALRGVEALDAKLARNAGGRPAPAPRAAVDLAAAGIVPEA